MQRGRKFVWQYFPWYMLIILGSLVAIGWYAAGALKGLYLGRTAEDLEARSRLLSEILLEDMRLGRDERIQSVCVSSGGELGTRFTVILPSGEVVGDSEEDPANMENHADRPEIQEAYDGNVGRSTRFSSTLKKEMMYVAVPLRWDGEVRTVVRSSVSVSMLSKTLSSLYRRIVLAGLIVAVAALLMSIGLSRRIQKPIHALKESALRFGRGELEHRVHISDPEEFMLLGDAMNKMAAELNERLHAIIRQRNELESILASMTEAVLVIDEEENIVRFNRAAASLFGVDAEIAGVKSIQEIIRNMQLLRFIRGILTSRKTGEKEIVIHETQDRYLQAYGTVLYDHEKKIIGALVVLNDITRLKRLENIRKDFVANVSHELKTPVTAIKGSVETLKDGAVENAEDAKRFLNIIQKHVDRLNALIEDLLNLSIIEEAEKDQIVFEKVSVRDVLEEAVSVCTDKANGKKIRILVKCDPDLFAWINAPLLEEAVINLIDNAVKYSERGGTVRIECRRENEETVVRIIDTGCGIAPEHHSRIFERFYRVDKARSRALGGTGLGLAIVKHIVQAHGGNVGVESEIEKGSVFTIRIPQV
ncbi:MAG: ATP-binding protein [bacterium]